MKREFKEIPLSDIFPTSDNKRKNIEKSEGFDELVSSIKAGGIRQVVQVRLHPDNKGKFELRSGERRYRAAKAAGVKTIPALVYTGLTCAEAMDLTFIENKFRQDLKPLEEAAEVALMMERFGNNVKLVSQRIGKDIQWVYARANIAKGLIKQWRTLIEGKDVRFSNWTLSHLLLIARLPEHIQNILLKDISGTNFNRPENMSAADLEEFIGKALHLLSKAKWDLNDETLIPKAGACSKCTKRSGYQPMLWFDSEDQVDAGDQCLDGMCWQAKQVAWMQRRAKELKEKHPNLVFISKDHPQRQEAEMINESVGSYLTQWEYKSASKSTKGALPAMHVQGKAAGQLTYVKVDTQRSNMGARPKGTPTPMKQRQQQLDAKRWAQVLLDLRDKVGSTKVTELKLHDTAIGLMSLVALYGNDRACRGFDFIDFKFAAYVFFLLSPAKKGTKIADVLVQGPVTHAFHTSQYESINYTLTDVL